jgi:alkylhydroperoxidase family enzyme
MTWDVAGAGDGDAVRALAPQAWVAFDAMVATVAAAPPPVIVELTRRRIGQVHGAGTGVEQADEQIDEQADEQERSLTTWSISPGFTTAERTCLGFAEQFVADVGSIDAEQREQLGAALGADQFEYVQAVYVLDFGARLVAAVRQLFDIELVPEVGDAAAVAESGMWPPIDAFLTEVARLSALDPLLTELIRLRGARAHRCRLCQSRRNLSAVAADGGERAIDALDDYESSDLSKRLKVALRLTDAIVWQPTAYPPGLVAEVRAELTPAEALEIVFDVARNAANKIAVALGADQANVTDGVEYFDVEPDGTLVYGLTR